MAYLEPEIEETLSKEEYLAQKEYPLYPGLTEQGRKDIEEMLKKAVATIKEKVNDEIGNVIFSMIEDYTEYAEVNSWNTMRQRFMYGMTHYSTSKKQGRYDFQKIRQAMLKESREDIIKDLNQDLLEKIEKLEKENKTLRESLNRNHY